MVVEEVVVIVSVVLGVVVVGGVEAHGSDVGDCGLLGSVNMVDTWQWSRGVVVVVESWWWWSRGVAVLVILESW